MISDIGKNRGESKPRSARPWLLSFVDLLSLILVFFVMMYASHDVPVQRYEEIRDSYLSYINGEENAQKVNFVPKEGKIVTVKSSANLSYIETLIKNGDSGRLGWTVVTDGNRVIVSTSDEAETPKKLAEKIDERLIALSTVINPLSNQVEVVTFAGDTTTDLAISQLVAQRLQTLGHEFKILSTLPTENIISENVDKNKNTATIRIIINRHESVL